MVARLAHERGLLVAVDNTVLSFAVPAISEALRPGGTELLWIVDIYPLVLAVLLVPTTVPETS